MTQLPSAADRLRLVEFANLAPSVHNTQPARWHFGEEGDVWILSDPRRHLRIGDPTLRDAGLSCGAALEATILGLSTFGIETVAVDDLWNSGETPPISGTLPVAKLMTRKGAAPLELADLLRRRFTWRRAFLPPAGDAARALAAWALACGDLKLITEPAEIATLSGFNDRASLSFLRKPDYRGELLSWMRLGRSDPRWHIDGLNATALGMSSIEALGAGFVLRTPMFELLDRVGLAASVVTERAKTETVTGIGVFHRPLEESPVVTGRVYLSLLLNLTRLGFQTWPMTAIADDLEISAEACRRYSIPDSNRLVNVLRIGAVPTGVAPGRARIAPSDLIPSEQF
jgi:hypothetical protein